MLLLQPALLIILVAFTHLCCATDDWIYRYTLIFRILTITSNHAEMCVRVCVWLIQLVKPVIECVRPPRGSTDSTVAGFIVWGTVVMYTHSSHPFIHSAAWCIVCGFYGLTLSIECHIWVDQDEPRYPVASYISHFTGRLRCNLERRWRISVF